MKEPWFEPWKWIYLPMGWQGWFALLVALLFFIQAVVVTAAGTKSGVEVLFNAVPYFVCTFGALLWVASKTSSAR